MTKTELNAFRKTLENRQAELGKGNGNREALLIQSSPDELDRIQHASAMAIGNIERDSSRVLEVRAALRRFDAGTFGSCVECEATINPKRLAAIPWASSVLSARKLRIASRKRRGTKLTHRSSWRPEMRCGTVFPARSFRIMRAQ
jgi:DnaK suppressor protein